VGVVVQMLEGALGLGKGGAASSEGQGQGHSQGPDRQVQRAVADWALHDAQDPVFEKLMQLLPTAPVKL
jgi:hypothetical protein